MKLYDKHFPCMNVNSGDMMKSDFFSTCKLASYYLFLSENI